MSRLSFVLMKRIAASKIGVLGGLLLTGLLFARFAWHDAPAPRGGTEAQNVNLALRRTAHYLLREAGDSTSRIPPVEQVDARTWRVRLDHAFDYDRLPGLLQASFDLHHIGSDYNVAVLDCASGALQLGYNFLDFKKNAQAACGGRTIDEGCYQIQITFLQPEAAKTPAWLAWLLAFGLLTGAGVLFWRWRKAGEKPVLHGETDRETDRLFFGNSSLSVANQILTANGVRHDLTYREAKLLHLFAGQPGQLLERDLILQQVWADEGILVGRSMDVFVSRLRKMLRDDPAVRIVAVHGVGYRLETGGV